MKDTHRTISEVFPLAESMPIMCDEASCSVIIKLLLLGRPPWTLRQFRSPLIWLLSTGYGALLVGFAYSTVRKLRMEYRQLTGDVTSVRFVTLGHDAFSLLGVLFLTLHAYVKWPDRAIQICAEYSVLRPCRTLLRLIVLNIPGAAILAVNFYWQAIVFRTWMDVAEAVCHHLVSIVTWNGLWMYIIVRLWLVYRQLKDGVLDSMKADLLSMLGRLDELNREVGLYLLLLVGKSVFDAISSLTFYSLQESSLPQILLAHEALVILYDLIYCAIAAELATRISTCIRLELAREAPVLAKVSQSMTAGGGAVSWPVLAAHCPAALPQGIDAFGVFTLNRSLFVTLCGTTLTFLLILVQLSPEVQRKISHASNGATANAKTSAANSARA